MFALLFREKAVWCKAFKQKTSATPEPLCDEYSVCSALRSVKRAV
ncbi:MAG: hypothetical protein ACI4IS_02015 [Acutalibacteraceae bacterium]